jgi:hypothetical protein
MTKLFAMRTFRLEKKPGRLTRSATSRRCGTIASVLGVALSIAALLIARPAAAAFVNFSQSNEVVTPSSADSRRLSKYFTPPYRLGPLPPEVSEILLRSAGPQLDRACATMIDSWGANVRGSARVSLRILAVAGGNAWVAYRCDSRLPQYENEYSERLAIFSAKRGGLQFIDLAAADDTRATLYHVALANVLKLIGAENSAAFELFAVNSTPVDGKANRSTRDWVSENRYVIVANSAAATKIALSLVTARVRPGANYRAGSGGVDDNAGFESRAGLRFGHDRAGHLMAVNVYHHDYSGDYHRNNPGDRSDAESRYGVTHYDWNRATLTFEVTRPETLPPVPISGRSHSRQLAN